jgi:hypothetical protein
LLSADLFCELKVCSLEALMVHSHKLSIDLNASPGTPPQTRGLPHTFCPRRVSQRLFPVCTTWGVKRRAKPDPVKPRPIARHFCRAARNLRRANPTFTVPSRFSSSMTSQNPSLLLSADRADKSALFKVQVKLMFLTRRPLLRYMRFIAHPSIPASPANPKFPSHGPNSLAKTHKDAKPLANCDFS